MNPKDLSKIIAAHTAELRSQGLEAAATDLERLVEAREGILVDEAFGGIEMVDTELPKDADGNDIAPMDRVHADHRSESAIRAQLHLDKIKGLPERKDPLLLDVLTGRRHGDVRAAIDRASQNRDKPLFLSQEELAKQYPERTGYGIRPGVTPLETDPQTFGGINMQDLQPLFDMQKGSESLRVETQPGEMIAPLTAAERQLQAIKDSKDRFQFYDANRQVIERGGAYRAYHPSQPLDHPAMESQQERHQRWLDDMHAAWAPVLDAEEHARVHRSIINQLFAYLYPKMPTESWLKRAWRRIKTALSIGMDL